MIKKTKRKKRANEQQQEKESNLIFKASFGELINKRACPNWQILHTNHPTPHICKV